MALSKIVGGDGHPLCVEVRQLMIALTIGGADAELTTLRKEPLSQQAFSTLLAACEHHRLLGALAGAVETGGLAVTDEQRDKLSERYLVWLSHSLEVERVLLAVGECLGRAGIEFRVLKGVALAHLMYPEPSSRVFGDLDLLIPASSFDDAVRLAREELGGIQPLSQLRPGFDREFGKEALVRVGDIEVDLHRTFVTGPFGLTIPLGELFEESRSFEVGGRTFRALDPTTMLMHAFYNAALGDRPVRLGSLRDLLLLVQGPESQLNQVELLAHRWHGCAVIQHGAALAVETLDLPKSHKLWRLVGLESPWRERLALRSYLTTARSYSRPLASLLVIPGLRARTRYAWALLHPSPEYLRSRGWTQRGHVMRALDRLRGIRRG